MISAFAIVVSNGAANPFGIEISTHNAITSDPLKCDKNGAYCASDCSTLLVCANNNPTPIASISCSSPNQYCVGSACTSIANSECPDDSSFICTDDGHFPEPSDCRRSRVCSVGVSKLYECPVGFVFNSHLNMCQQGTTPCTKIDCSKATPVNPYIVFASNPAFYALCLNNGNGYIQTFMFKCPYEKFEVFDTTINACRFNCAAKGYFQNPDNCNEYFYCSAALTSTKPTLLECPADFVFDGTTCNRDSTACKFPPKSKDEDEEEEEEEEEEVTTTMP